MCADLNDNAVCDPSEPSAITDVAGQFFLRAPAASLVADVMTTSLNNGQPVDSHVVFRAPVDAIAGDVGQPAKASTVVIGPLSTEIARMMAADGLTYAQAKQNLGLRLGAPASQVVTDLNKLADSATRRALVAESVVLTNRFALAAKMVDRGDISPAALGVDPNGVPGS